MTTVAVHPPSNHFPESGMERPVIRSADSWGPFAPDLEPGERVARLRILRAIAHLLLGPRGLNLQGSIRAAEQHRTMGRLSDVLSEIDALAAKDRRNVLTSYAAVTRP
ncbi:hypothetical protein [Methylobacterium sp. CM6246]